MMIALKLAWRNTFRNKRRTIITGIAVGLGLASLIFVDALVIGMNDNLVQSATSTFLGQGQIHAEGFRIKQDTDNTIKSFALVKQELANDKLVKHYASRVLTYAMIASAADVYSVELAGIEPENEEYLSEMDNNIINGSYFKEGGERDIVIGSGLAGRLEVGVGDKVVVTVAQAKAGDLSQEMFRVSGIYRMRIDEMDKGMALVRLKKSQDMLGIGDNAHEIAVQFVDPENGSNESLGFWKKYSENGNEALGWPLLMPALKGALDMSSFGTYITGIILFGIIAFGIINTLFMSLYERMFEFGVLRAVGTRPFGIARLILLEAGVLAVLSILLGSILGLAANLITAKTGIDYNGIEYAGVTFRHLIYPITTLKQFIIYPVWVFFFTIAAGVYPAIYAARMAPIEAMRKSM